MTNPVRFGQDFIGRVANPRDVLQYYRKKKTEKSSSLRKPACPVKLIPRGRGCQQARRS